MRKKLVLLFFVLSIFLVSCNQENRTQTYLENNKNIATEQESLEKIPENEIGDKFKGYNFTFTDETSVNEQYQYTFKLSSNSEFQPNITISNDHDKEINYEVMFLLNNEQIPVKYKDEKHDYIKIKIPSYSKMNLAKLTFEDFPEGENNLTAILLREPNQHVQGKNTYVPGNQMVMIQRFSVLVGENSKAPHSSDNVKIINSQKTEKQSEPYLTHSSFAPISDSIGMFSNVNKSLWLNFYAQDNNLYYIGLIVGKEFVKLDQPYIKTNGEGLASLKIPIDLKNYDTEKNIVAFIIQNPLKSQVSQNGEINKNVLPYIQPSNIVTYQP